jgi:signal transduction histidine kinase
LLKGRYSEPAEKIHATLLQTGRWEGEVTQTTADGREIVVQCEWALWRDKTGRPTAVLVSNTDITARKRAEEALRQARDELARLNGQLEQRVEERTAKLRKTVGELEHFSYSITHDMRAPLRAMRGFASLLLKECAGELEPSHQEFLQHIAQGAERMDRLIVDALDYGKVLREKLPLTTVDADALLRGMLKTYPAWQPPHARIEVRGQLPSVSANEAGLTQCFSNLLNNAVKFVAPTQTPQVHIWAEPRNESVRLWVEDNGIGIAPEYHERIFHMFQRLNKQYEGTGIGLALVRKVAERMAGQVGVESEPGKGSRFWLELKAAGEPARKGV